MGKQRYIEISATLLQEFYKDSPEPERSLLAATDQQYFVYQGLGAAG
jgi:hypothetical protein